MIKTSNGKNRHSDVGLDCVGFSQFGSMILSAAPMPERHMLGDVFTLGILFEVEVLSRGGFRIPSSLRLR